MASNQTTLPNVSENEETLLTGVNENVYEDQSIGAELTKKDINRVAWRSMLLQASFNYERMQASGWLYGLLPALKKIHTNKRDLARAMKGHMGFFNTHPLLSALSLRWSVLSRTLTVFRAPKLPSVRRSAGLAMQCSG